MSQKTFLLLTVITLAGAVLRFTGLSWGQPYPFHPDEHNLSAAVERLHYDFNCLKQDLSKLYRRSALRLYPSTCNLNPRFFAYGSFPIYLTYFTSQILNFFFQISNIKYLISNTLILRFYSALASTLTIPLVYLITKLLLNCEWRRNQATNSAENVLNWKFRILNFFGIWDLGFGHLAALLAAFTPGLIQAAHFGTTESLLTFFFLIILYLSLKILTCKFQAPSTKHQINSKHQAPNSKQSLNSNIQIRNKRFEILNLENWKLFGIWDLGFWIYTIALAIVSGLALSTKLTALLFLPIPLLGLSLKFLKTLPTSHLSHSTSPIPPPIPPPTSHLPIIQLSNYPIPHPTSHIPPPITQYLNIFFLFSRLLVLLVLFVLSVLSVTFLTSPYYLLDFPSLRSSLNYESSVALGAMDVFYTRQFINTTPFLFHAQKIFPFALSWPLFIFGALGFVLLLLNTVFRVFSRKISRRFAILLTAFLIYLIPNAIVYAKWTRFMTPLFPFFPIFTAASLLWLSQTIFRVVSRKFLRRFAIYCLKALTILLIISQSLSGLSFFSIYTRPDVRFTASNWIYQNIPENSHLLFETANVIDIPIPTAHIPQPTTYSKTSFNFYDLDINPRLQQDLLDELVKADYIFIPSRRIFKNYTRFPDRWPLLNRYYDLLFSGQLGFEPAAFFASFPQLSIFKFRRNQGSAQSAGSYYQLSINDESSEESFTVFDHPVIRIYQKTVQLSKKEYRKLLQL